MDGFGIKKRTKKPNQTKPTKPNQNVNYKEVYFYFYFVTVQMRQSRNKETRI